MAALCECNSLLEMSKEIKAQTVHKIYLILGVLFVCFVAANTQNILNWKV